MTSWTIPWNYRRVEYSGQVIDLSTCNLTALGVEIHDPLRPYVLDISYDDWNKLFNIIARSGERTYPGEGVRLLWEFWKSVKCIRDDDPDEQEDCVTIPAYDPLIQWSLGNPFTDPNPNGTLFPLWYRFPFFIPDFLPQFLIDFIADIQEELTGYQRGDVATLWAGQFQPGDDSNNILSYPGFSIQVTGQGRALLNLLQVPLGGAAIISVDVQPDIGSILSGIIDDRVKVVELDRDFVQLPPETDEDALEEVIIDFGSPTDVHTIYVQFVPIVDDQLAILSYGGGLRSIELCGFDLTNYQATIPDEVIVTTMTELKDAIAEILLLASGGITNNCDPCTGDSEDEATEDVITELDGTLSYALGNDAERSAHLGGIYRLLLEFNMALDYAFVQTQATTDNAAIEAQLGLRYEIFVGAAVGLWLDDLRFLPSAPAFTSAQADAMAEYIYSNTGQFNNRIASEVTAIVGGSNAANMLLALNVITESQLATWYALGLAQPRDEWLDYAVTPVPTQTVEFTADDIAAQNRVQGLYGYPIRKSLVRVTISGSYTLDNGTVRDAMYDRATDGTLTYNPFGIAFLGSIANQIYLDFEQPLYREDGVYTFSAIGTPTSVLPGIGGRERRSVSNYSGTGTEIVFTVTLRDLGETL